MTLSQIVKSATKKSGVVEKFDEASQEYVYLMPAAICGGKKESAIMVETCTRQFFTDQLMKDMLPGWEDM